MTIAIVGGCRRASVIHLVRRESALANAPAYFGVCQTADMNGGIALLTGML